MASSGSFSGSIHSGHYVLRVDWTQTKNVSVNTSTITAKAYLVNDWSLSINARSDNKVTIDGTAQTYASPAISSTGTHLLGTVTQTVNHGSDGTKSLAMSAVFYIRATLSGTYYESITASANITLDSIARASTVSASNVEMGSATTIAISRASSSFTHTLTYAFGSATGTIATKTTSTSVSWTPPLMLAGQIPKAVTGTGTITCTTYNGNTSIGSKTCTLTLTVPASVKPTITSLTAARVDGAVPSTWGIYVQTKSKATLTINGAAGSYGSTISSYSITGGGYTSTASSFTTGFLNTSGTVTFTATVTDSRGRVSAAATVSISVVAYSPPSFASYLSQRCLSSGTANDDGTYIRGQVSYSYTSCSSKNTITRATYYKKASDTAWTNAGASFSSGTAFTFGGGNISTKTSYDIKSRLWQIHVFGEGNTRTTAVFFIKYLRTLGFDATNDIFAENAWYFRNALVRANYNDLKNGVHETTEYLELFLRNLLLDEKNELHNRTMHISGRFAEVDIERVKVDIKSREVDIESTKVDIRNKLLSFSDTISEKTINHTVEIFSKCGKENCFGRTIVEEITGLKPSRASKLIKLLVDSEVIVPVTGHGKGKYRFQ